MIFGCVDKWMFCLFGVVSIINSFIYSYIVVENISCLFVREEFDVLFYIDEFSRVNGLCFE